jgi:cytochrome b subunit of formate dehydrogenase
MKLSVQAQGTLDNALKINQTSQADKEEIEEILRLMPDDRVLLFKNVDSNPIGDLPRYSIHIRIQHMLIFVTFLTLAFTGLPIKFFDSLWAEPLNSIIGGVDVSRIVHRTLAVAMIFAMLYHIATITLGSISLIARKRFEVSRTMIPVWKDLVDFKNDILYFAGRREQRPEMDKFMYKQKLHYFAAAFGNMVMIVSGSTFLFPEVWASILPQSIASQFQEFMRLSHPHEALLALLVIAFWHWYNVHLAPGRFPMQWTFLTGKITREHQLEEHFLEYVRNLVEIPEERKYMKNLLISSGLAQLQPVGEEVDKGLQGSET